jgi:Holliday junction resolvase RusA-like endonuclease
MTDPYKLDITIPKLPKRINQGHGSHWTKRYAESKMWMRLVGAHVRFQIPDEPLQKASVKIIRASSVCPDFDGLVYSGKVLIDALKKLNIIKDDSMKVIGQPIYEWAKAKPKQGYVRIMVEEITESSSEQQALEQLSAESIL